eukprot:TRINITY_DN10400_c0_g1_i1.p1 TRINITY_DN10400_c0_g1~~TRINITY_DN10400_c0_g1_i1.p1  ORF type:complete len:711 (+),score=112.15 TRINITY_DN10400_c0_g1_i1:147-2279(+)
MLPAPQPPAAPPRRLPKGVATPPQQVSGGAPRARRGARARPRRCRRGGARRPGARALAQPWGAPLAPVRPLAEGQGRVPRAPAGGRAAVAKAGWLPLLPRPPPAAAPGRRLPARLPPLPAPHPRCPRCASPLQQRLGAPAAPGIRGAAVLFAVAPPPVGFPEPAQAPSAAEQQPRADGQRRLRLAPPLAPGGAVAIPSSPADPAPACRAAPGVRRVEGALGHRGGVVGETAGLGVREQLHPPRKGSTAPRGGENAVVRRVARQGGGREPARERGDGRAARQARVAVRLSPSGPSRTDLDFQNAHPDPLPPKAGWAAACEMVKAFKSPPAGPLDGRFSIVMTTYKGRATVRHTFDTWNASRLLHHSRLHEILIHINACTCADIDFLTATLQLFAPQLPRRYICYVGNRIHPQAMIAAILSARTPYVLFTENDRPTLPYHGEAAAEMRARVTAQLSSALAALADENTPFVLLERLGPSPADVALWRTYKSQRKRRGLPPPNFLVERDLPEWFQKGKYGGLRDCWPTCMEVAWMATKDRRDFCGTALTPPDQRRDHAGAVTRRIAAQGAPRGVLSSVFQMGPVGFIHDPRPVLDCGVVVCREWEAFQRGWPLSPHMCAITFAKDALGEASANSRQNSFIAVTGNDTVRSPFRVCLRVNNWSNGPSIFRLDWYHAKVFHPMCYNQKSAFRSGLEYRPSRPHFGRYGRHMEYLYH